MSQYYGNNSYTNYYINNSNNMMTLGAQGIVPTQFTMSGMQQYSEAFNTYDFGRTLKNVSSASFNSAVKTDGTLWAWGVNDTGQLGTGDRTDRYSPVQIGTDTNWSRVYSGYTQTFAIKTNGTLWAWGNNTFGLLGINTSGSRSSPVKVGTDSNWSTVVSGYYHTLAIKTDGTLWAWGNNSYGQLGLNDYPHRSIPYQVGTNTNWTKVAAGRYHTAGIAYVTGSLYVWGSNLHGQLGLNTSSTVNFLSPVQPALFSNWTDICCGELHTTGIHYESALTREKGTLWSWGNNSYGQLGTNTVSGNIISPVQIGVDSNWTSVSAAISVENTVALKTDGTIWGFGENIEDGLAWSTVSYASPKFMFTIGGMYSNWTKVIAADNAVFAINSNNSLYAVGNNYYTPLGFLPTNTYTQTPLLVNESKTWSKFPSGSRNGRWGAAIDSSQTLYTFGENYGTIANYQASAAAQLNTTETVPVGDVNYANDHYMMDPVEVDVNVSTCSIGDDFGVYIKTDGTLWGWGNTTIGQLTANNTSGYPKAIPLFSDPYSPDLVPTIPSGISYISGRSLNAALIRNDNTLWVWGNNSYKQLGTSNTSSQPIPIKFPGTWSKISVNGSYMSAIDTNGILWTWGDNLTYYLGSPSLTGHRTFGFPQNPAPGTWKDVSNSLAIRTDGTLWAWGYNATGQLGLNTVSNLSTPMQVGTLSNWSTIVSDGTSSFAIKTDGTLWVWGYNADGQLGLSNLTNRSSPVQLGSATWSKITANGESTLGIQTNGTLWAWGKNLFGQLGLNTSSSSSVLSPAQVGTDTNWSDVCIGKSGSSGRHTLAVKTDGTLWACGTSENYQLGLNTNNYNYRSLVQVGSATNWSSVAIIDGNSMALNNSGTLYTCGSGGNLGFIPQVVYKPILIDSGTWLNVHAGSAHYLAIKSDNTLWAQGSNSWGQLGVGDQINRSSLVQVGTLSNWSKVACGDSFSTALKTDGTLWAWGNNSFGQLGQSDRLSRSSPVQVGTINTYYKLFALHSTILAEIV